MSAWSKNTPIKIIFHEKKRKKNNIVVYLIWNYFVYFNIFKSESEFVTKVSQFWPAGRENFPASGVKGNSCEFSLWTGDQKNKNVQTLNENSATEDLLFIISNTSIILKFSSLAYCY